MGWPKIVGSYIVRELLGHGNYGEVRIAEHIRTRRQYAVKILPRQFLEVTEYTIDVRREMVSRYSTFCMGVSSALHFHNFFGSRHIV